MQNYNSKFKILKTFYFLLALLTFAFYLLPLTVYAEVDIGQNFGFGNITSLGQATSQLVNPVFSIASFLVILYFLLGAFKYLKSGGNKEEVEAARQMIQHAIIGFLLLMLAFLILQFLLSSLFQINNFMIF